MRSLKRFSANSPEQSSHYVAMDLVWPLPLLYTVRCSMYDVGGAGRVLRTRALGHENMTPYAGVLSKLCECRRLAPPPPPPLCTDMNPLFAPSRLCSVPGMDAKPLLLAHLHNMASSSTQGQGQAFSRALRCSFTCTLFKVLSRSYLLTLAFTFWTSRYDCRTHRPRHAENHAEHGRRTFRAGLAALMAVMG